MGLFSEMEKYGLGALTDIDIIEKKKTKIVSVDKNIAPVEKKEEDVLFNKKYECPVCGLMFEAKCLRIGKVKLIRKDTDLRPIYDFMDPLKYDVIACDKCGYAAVTRYFGKLSTRQIKELKENVGKNFSGLDTEGDTYSYDDAIIRHKLALVCTIVKNAKNSERAITCLKLAWVLRGKRGTLPDTHPQAKRLYDEEIECLKNAHEGFTRALSNETMPIAGMDVYTITYVLADLARRLKKYNESIKYISSILTDKAASKRIKDEAYRLKELVKEDLKNDDGISQ